MSKYYIIIAHNGTEIIDDTPEAENRIASMDYQEERAERERKRSQKRKIAWNPLYKLAGLCGLI